MIAQEKEDRAQALPPPVNPGINLLNCWWSNQVLSDSSHDYRDFVLISEFSELEGPLPLAVVTESIYLDLKHGYAKTTSNEVVLPGLDDHLSALGLSHFDFHAFALRVVSIDRGADDIQDEAAFLFDSESADPGCIFSIPDDTQVYSTDVDQRFYAFTHHLTLFDIHARGYVHPVALSYISRDPDKIVLRFEEFMDRFNEVSRLMKIGNFSNFALDLKHRFLDLEHTKQTLEKDCSQASGPLNEPHKPSCLSIKAVQQAITSTRLMMDTVESYAAQLARDDAEQNQEVSLAQSAETQLSLKATDSLASDVEIEDVETNGVDAKRSSRAESYFSETDTETENYEPRCIDTLYPVPHFERKLRSLAQLCQEPDLTSQPRQKGKKKHSLPQTTVIPLVSIITPQFKTSSKQQRSFASAIAHDMYSEAIAYTTAIVSDMGRSSVVLDVEEEEADCMDPLQSAISVGRLFVLNLDNPSPRILENSPANQKWAVDSYFGDTLPANQSTSADKTPQTHREKRQRVSQTDSAFFPIQLETARLWEGGKGGLGEQRLLEVCRTFGHAIHHVLFSLMTGRPVVIIGHYESKSKVKEVVEALGVFVPGHSRQHHQIESWFVGTRLTDDNLGSMKLVGTDRDNLDANVYRLDISCLDIDAVSQHQQGNLVTSPLYLDGQWINQLLEQLPFYSSDGAYLAYLHTVFITIALKAYVYHHMFVKGRGMTDDDPQSPLTSEPTTPHSKDDMPSDSDNELGRKWSVRRIMNYLNRIEQRENQSEFSHPKFSSLHRHILNQFPGTEEEEEEEEEETSFSDENEITVTPHSLHYDQVQPQPSRPTTIADMNWFPFSPAKPRRRPSEAGSESSAGESSQTLAKECNQVLLESSSEDSSGEDVEEDMRRTRSHSRRSLQSEDEQMESLSSMEKQGRRFLQEKLRVYGDDQTIVVYLANL
ncbi:hypothetical protein CLU79DRAFT_769125 [Phycomyces nitens]|nr:hypothetical protein CLU79DRAFT_769125 [Phycomyces nitens]